ncbi:MAG: LrgB family protein [Bacillota bacterium]|jgi:putative effector of murein hydrolase
MINIFSDLDLSYLTIFGVGLTFIAFIAGNWLHKKLRYFPLINSSVIAITLIITILNILGISYEDYNVGGDLFTILLFPTTAALAVPIYRQRELIKKNFLPIIVGTAVGSITGMGSVYGLCRLFGYDSFLTYSIMGKSVTTPIAMEITRLLGGEQSVVIIGVTIAGLLSSIYLPVFLKLTKIKNPVALGIATGSSSHGYGTSVAMTLSEEMGAMSSISIGITGLFTMLFALLLPW